MMSGFRKEEAVSNDLSLVKKLSKALSPAFGRMRTLLRKISGFLPELLCRMRYRSSLYRSSCRIAKYSDLKKDRGAYGEFLVYDALRREKGRWLFNLYLPKGEEKTEIDALLLSERGIFLLESKNFSGRVYGSVGNPEWFHTFETSRGIKKQRFFNPIMQNSAHKKALGRLIGREEVIFPMVVFGKNTDLRVQAPKEYSKELMTLKRLPSAVHSFEKGALEQEEIERLYGVLEPYTRVDAHQKYCHRALVAKKNQKN